MFVKLLNGVHTESLTLWLNVCTVEGVTFPWSSAGAI